MWHAQSLMRDNVIFVKENVEIDIARSFVNDLLSAHGVLDILQLIQESQRFKSCLDLMMVSWCFSSISGKREV